MAFGEKSGRGKMEKIFNKEKGSIIQKRKVVYYTTKGGKIKTTEVSKKDRERY